MYSALIDCAMSSVRYSIVILSMNCMLASHASLVLINKGLAIIMTNLASGRRDLPRLDQWLFCIQPSANKDVVFHRGLVNFNKILLGRLYNLLVGSL